MTAIPPVWIYRLGVLSGALATVLALCAWTLLTWGLP